jgi:hypothetical protein
MAHNWVLGPWPAAARWKFGCSGGARGRERCGEGRGSHLWLIRSQSWGRGGSGDCVRRWQEAPTTGAPAPARSGLGRVHVRRLGLQRVLGGLESSLDCVSEQEGELGGSDIHGGAAASSGGGTGRRARGGGQWRFIGGSPTS